MSISPIAAHVYRETVERFGEPDHGFSFDDPPPPDDTWPAKIDVFVWEDDRECDVTTFATVGMCDRPMAGVDHRAELHFAVRRPAGLMNLEGVAQYCANVSLYPFANGTYFDWLHTLPNAGDIPYFPNCHGLLLHPAFVEEGWDEVDFEGTTVKILNAVPVTAAELAHGREHGPRSILDAVDGVDLFVDRTA